MLLQQLVVLASASTLGDPVHGKQALLHATPCHGQLLALHH
jgi:hypothetical protein